LAPLPEDVIAVELAPEPKPEARLPDEFPWAMPPPPSPPAPKAAEPEGDIASVAFSEFAGAPWLFPGCGETTTPVFEDTLEDPLPSPVALDDDAVFWRDGCAGVTTVAGKGATTAAPPFCKAL
jgi:hypothetical protein